MLVAHLYFVCAFVTEYFDKHFNWNKHVDSQTKCAGFLSAHTGIRYYIMHRDLEQLKIDWRTREAFKLYENTYPTNANTTSEAFATNIFNIASQRKNKHMQQ